MEVFQNATILARIQSESHAFEAEPVPVHANDAFQHIQLNTVYSQCYHNMINDKQLHKLKGKNLHFKGVLLLRLCSFLSSDIILLLLNTFSIFIC
jgi:hypothetical protein